LPTIVFVVVGSDVIRNILKRHSVWNFVHLSPGKEPCQRLKESCFAGARRTKKDFKPSETAIADLS